MSGQISARGDHSSVHWSAARSFSRGMFACRRHTSDFEVQQDFVCMRPDLVQGDPKHRPKITRGPALSLFRRRDVQRVVKCVDSVSLLFHLTPIDALICIICALSAGENESIVL